ncbi:MAG: hypothetical protein C4530_06985 [Desulfobacteraceae bacterium]|nr:MAG: hypothetical protein C4530_06985 [Desulfobacteraceae bacterium]
MPDRPMTDLSYYPGCSLVTTARESNSSLMHLFRHVGFNLIELEGWNCCGSSSAHSIDSPLAFDLACRNLALASPDRPLLVACPSCILRLRHAYLHLKEDPEARSRYRRKWGKSFDPGLNIIHYFELLDQIDLPSFCNGSARRLEGLKFVPYYGCMLAYPPLMRHQKNYYGLMEKILSSLGAGTQNWSYSSRCCGTFLTVARPEIVTPMINGIIEAAKAAGSDCIITACAMCHMNLEVRCTLEEKIPVLHFSEIVALALGIGKSHQKFWFSRHLVDPNPMLKALELF